MVRACVESRKRASASSSGDKVDARIETEIRDKAAAPRRRGVQRGGVGDAEAREQHGLSPVAIEFSCEQGDGTGLRRGRPFDASVEGDERPQRLRAGDGA